MDGPRSMARMLAYGIFAVVALGLLAIANNKWPQAIAWAVCGLFIVVAIVACAGWIQAARDRDRNAEYAKGWRMRVFDLERVRGNWRDQ